MIPLSVPVRQHASPQERAIARARAERTTVYYSDLEHCWFAASTSHPFRWHRVDPIAETCDCEAHGYCKHLAAAQVATMRACQECGARGDVVVRLYRVGGELGEVAVHECKDRQACQARQAVRWAR